MNSSKKWTNEFVFTTIRRAFIRFLEEIEDIKKTFRNYLTFNMWEIFKIWKKDGALFVTHSLTNSRSFILSYVHNIAYINVEKNKDTRLKIAVYYAVTFVENILLVSLWTTSKNPKLDFTPEQRRDVVS